MYVDNIPIPTHLTAEQADAVCDVLYAIASAIAAFYFEPEECCESLDDWPEGPEEDWPGEKP